jgi:hypothetical protein
MTNRKKDLHKALSAQEKLFDPGMSEGDLDVSMIFRDALSQALRKTDVSRHMVAARISELTNHSISKDMLDKYTSSNLDYGFRAEDLTAFCHAVGSIEPFRVLLAPLGYEIISPEESNFVKIARLEKKRGDIDAELAELRHRAGIRQAK